jgi:hypothetical protein
MKHQRNLTSILVLALCSGVISDCTTRPEKKLETKGFSLSFRDKASAKDKLSGGYSLKNIQFVHPLKISESDVRNNLESLMFEELSLFGKKKPVFTPQDIDRIAHLFTKALHHVPSNKFIHYELETTGGTTKGDIFASKKHIHWRLISIKGMAFFGRAYTGWGNANWRMVPQPDQNYHVIKNAMGTRAFENSVIAKLVSSKTKSKQKNPRFSNSTKTPSNKPGDTPPTKNLDPSLKEKLQFLKHLYEKNLINEKEYDLKKKELLSTYL